MVAIAVSSFHTVLLRFFCVPAFSIFVLHIPQLPYTFNVSVLLFFICAKDIVDSTINATIENNNFIFLNFIV